MGVDVLRRSAVALVVVLSACDGLGPARQTATSAGHQSLVTIRVTGSRSALGAVSAATKAEAVLRDESAAAAATTLLHPLQYSSAGSLPALDGDAQAWVYQVAARPGAGSVARLAKALSLAGEVVSMSNVRGGGFRVGATDGSTPTLVVGGDGAGPWSYDAGGGATAGEGCAGPTVAGSKVPTPASRRSVSTAVSRCISPPPQGAPSESQARARALDLARGIGLAAKDSDVTVNGDASGRHATITQSLDGTVVWSVLYVAWGEDGTLTEASGQLGILERGARYPRIGTKAAIDNLNARRGTYGAVPVPAAAAADPAGNPPPTGAPTTASATTTIVQSVTPPPAASIPVDSSPPVVVPVEPSSPLTDPVPVVDTTPIVATILRAGPALIEMVGNDGNVWLVPAYSFHTADDGDVVALAIDGSYVQLVTTTADASSSPTLRSGGEPGSAAPPTT